jgi:hypothetical protein
LGPPKFWCEWGVSKAVELRASLQVFFGTPFPMGKILAAFFKLFHPLSVGALPRSGCLQVVSSLSGTKPWSLVAQIPVEGLGRGGSLQREILRYFSYGAGFLHFFGLSHPVTERTPQRS